MTAPPQHAPPAGAPNAPERIWPALAVGFGLLPAALVMSVVVVGIAAALDQALGWTGLSPMTQQDAWAKAFFGNAPGLLVLILPGQLMFVGAALAGAFLSPKPWRERLGLVPAQMPKWGWPVLMLSTPSMGLLGTLFASLIWEEPSANLKLVNDILHSLEGPTILLGVALISITPAICEEFAFRGFVQRRLQRRWPAWAAIAAASLLFSAVHMDPQHVVAVIPLAFWFGVIAWRTDSLWPSMACHFANNLLAAIGLHLTPSSEATLNTLSTFDKGLLAVSAPALLASLFLLARLRRDGTAQGST